MTKCLPADKLATLEKLSVYGEALLNSDQAQYLILIKFIAPGREIASLIGDQTEMILTWKITDRGRQYCMAREEHRPRLLEIFRKVDNDG